MIIPEMIKAAHDVFKITVHKIPGPDAVRAILEAAEGVRPHPFSPSDLLTIETATRKLQEQGWRGPAEISGLTERAVSAENEVAKLGAALQKNGFETLEANEQLRKEIAGLKEDLRGEIASSMRTAELHDEAATKLEEMRKTLRALVAATGAVFLELVK